MGLLPLPGPCQKNQKAISKVLLEGCLDARVCPHILDSLLRAAYEIRKAERGLERAGINHSPQVKVPRALDRS